MFTALKEIGAGFLHFQDAGLQAVLFHLKLTFIADVKGGCGGKVLFVRAGIRHRPLVEGFYQPFTEGSRGLGIAAKGLVIRHAAMSQHLGYIHAAPLGFCGACKIINPLVQSGSGSGIEDIRKLLCFVRATCHLNSNIGNFADKRLRIR